MKKQKKGIQKRIFSSLLIVGILPGVLVIILMFVGGKNALERSNGNHLANIAQETSDKVQLFLQYKAQEVKNLGLVPYLRKLVEQTNVDKQPKTEEGTPQPLWTMAEDIVNYIQEYLRQYGQGNFKVGEDSEYLDIFLTNAQGDLLNPNDGTEEYNLSQWPEWQQSFKKGQGKLVVSDVVFDRRWGRPVIKIASPVMDEKALKAVGVIFMVLDAKSLSQMISEVRVGNTGFAQLVDSEGKIMIHPNKFQENKTLLRSIFQQVQSDGRGWIWSSQKERFQLGFSPVPILPPAKGLPSEQNWYLLIAQDSKEGLATLFALLFKVSLFGLAMILVLSFVELYRAHKIVKPIERLQQGASIIGQGDLSHRIQIKTGDEIEALADDINEMTRKLQKSQEEVNLRNKDLATQNEMMRAMANSLHIDEVLSILVDQIRKHLQFDRVGLFLVNKQDNTLVQRIGTDVYGHVTLSEKKTIPIDENSGPMGHMMVHGEKLFITNDYFKDPRVDKTCVEYEQSDPNVSGRALVAIVFRQDVLGIIALDNLLSGKIVSEDNVTILENFADSVGISVKNAQLYQELEQTNEELIESNEIKAKFMSMVSHELRTPLMIIKESISQILDGLKGEINQDQREFLSIGKKNSDRLNLIIEELLAVSRIEAGKVELLRELVDVEKVCLEVAHSFNVEAEKKKLELKTDFEPNLPKLYIDAPKIIQVLTNLVGNAFKFTSQGSITIGTKRSEKGVKVYVHDTGIGIPKGLHEKIFKRFERADSTPFSGASSTGLGLSIAKDYIELHHGVIGVESEEGEGSTFYFELPIYTEEAFFSEFLDDLLKSAKQHHTLLSLLHLKVKNNSSDLVVVLDSLKDLIKSVGLRTKGIVNLADKGEVVIVAETDRTGVKAMEGRIRSALERDDTLSEYLKEDGILFSSGTYPKNGLSREELLTHIELKFKAYS